MKFRRWLNRRLPPKPFSQKEREELEVNFARLAAGLKETDGQYAREWDGWPELVAVLGGDEALADGVFSIAWRSSLSWVHSPVPALGDRSALELLAMPGGRAVLLDAILRYPAY